MENGLETVVGAETEVPEGELATPEETETILKLFTGMILSKDGTSADATLTDGRTVTLPVITMENQRKALALTRKHVDQLLYPDANQPKA